jgi:hypothetical protein
MPNRGCPPNGDQSSPYDATENGIVWYRPTKDGVAQVKLTNFNAKIVGDCIQDDGVEQRCTFEIEAHLNTRTHRFAVPAKQFAAMSWVGEYLGAEAMVYPGQALKDHARAEVQILSGRISRRTIYQHLGWRKIDNEWRYLHCGRAIGATGVRSDIEVDPGEALAAYRLPELKVGEELTDAVKASFRMLKAAREDISFPMLIATYRPILGPADYSVASSGTTGAGKSELSAIALQHYGPDMNSRKLPANWSSTENALEAVAFGAKDALLVVDDFARSGTQHEVSAYHRKAERLLRAQGNRAGRQRMWADGTLRATKYPRGLILSTGEDVPRGQSLRARMLIVEVKQDRVHWEVISEMQRYGIQAILANAMAGFIQWVAQRYDELIPSWASRVTEQRSALSDLADIHRRSQTFG